MYFKQKKNRQKLCIRVPFCCLYSVDSARDEKDKRLCLLCAVHKENAGLKMHLLSNLRLCLHRDIYMRLHNS